MKTKIALAPPVDSVMPNGKGTRRFWRSRKPPKPPDDTVQELNNAFVHFSTALRLTLNFLKETSDVFPPLKSAVSALLEIHAICDTAKGNKGRATELRDEVVQTIDCLSKLFVEDPLMEAPHLLNLREDFENFCKSCQNILNELAVIRERRHIYSRIFHSKDDEKIINCASISLNCARHLLQLAISNHQTKMLAENLRLEESTHSKLDKLDVRLQRAYEKVEYIQVTMMRTLTASVFLFGELSPLRVHEPETTFTLDCFTSNPTPNPRHRTLGWCVRHSISLVA